MCSCTRGITAVYVQRLTAFPNIFCPFPARAVKGVYAQLACLELHCVYIKVLENIGLHVYENSRGLLRHLCVSLIRVSHWDTRLTRSIFYAQFLGRAAEGTQLTLLNLGAG